MNISQLIEKTDEIIRKDYSVKKPMIYLTINGYYSPNTTSVRLLPIASSPRGNVFKHYEDKVTARFNAKTLFRWFTDRLMFDDRCFD